MSPSPAVPPTPPGEPTGSRRRPSRRSVLLAGALGAALPALGRVPAGAAALDAGADAYAPDRVAPLSPSAVAAEAHSIVFPVEGRVSFVDTFGAPRSGGRTHQGQDIFGAKLQRLRATDSGVVEFTRTDSSGLSGNMISLRADDGWVSWYIHINNDSPGTDDGANPALWRFAPGLREGSRVVAGQFLAHLGDSGNAETTPPHLHFELHQPDGTVINPYASLLSAARPGPVAGRAVAAHPRAGYYVLMADGRVHSFDGAPHYGSPRLGLPLAKTLEVMPDGQGYVVLDGWGGLHRFGSAVRELPDFPGLPYWRGFDIVRDLALTSTGRGLIMLDGWGGLHRFGDAPVVGGTPYWRGWDIARAVAITADDRGVLVLDGYGGVHAGGSATARANGPYWPGQDVARDLVATPAGGYAVLDHFGGIWPVGPAARADGRSWALGADAQGLTLRAGDYRVVYDSGLSVRG